jgi:hypothetical protein
MQRRVLVPCGEGIAQMDEQIIAIPWHLLAGGTE